MSAFLLRSIFFLAVLVPTLSGVAFAAADGHIHPAPQQRPAFARDSLAIMGQDGSRQRLMVEVARSPDELAYGLMKVKELPGTDGMLFIAPKPQQQLFWMKDTLIPLDLLFIDPNGRIMHIVPLAQPMSERYLASRGVAKAVLEIGGGLAERWHIKVGDTVNYKDFQ